MIERPAARYGGQRQSPGHRRWLVIGVTAVAIVVGVAVAVFAARQFGAPEVKGELGAYELIDDETVKVTISVTRDDPSQPVSCIVRARSLDGAETGRREVLVAPSTHTTVVIDTIVKSTRKPVMGDIYGCGADVPPYLTDS
ncbi:DUF4307 domain-containing protein [Mycolicibacterium phlei]|jgi:hypothetical protein